MTICGRTMPSLRDVERAFAAALLDPQAPPPAHIAAGRYGAARHFNVYRHNIDATLTRALSDTYPVVTRLVGEAFLRFAAASYFAAHPSQSGNLHDAGAHFADFLAAFEPTRTLAYLPDVARLEWAWHTAFHAPEAPAFDRAALGAVPAADYPRLRFALHPSATLVASRFPILRIWQVNQLDVDDPPTVDLDAGGCRLLVRRPRADASVVIEPLTASDDALLGALAAGARFADVATVAAAMPDVDLGARLHAYIVRQVIVRFFTDQPPEEESIC